MSSNIIGYFPRKSLSPSEKVKKEVGIRFFFGYMSSIEKHLNKFVIGYIVNPKLNMNKVFGEQVDKRFNF